MAEDAGLEIDEKNGGIVVNCELEARSGVFAAGDVASFPDQALGRRRVEHYNHAASTGRTAGKNMVGKNDTYNATGTFWTDLLDVGVSMQAAGRQTRLISYLLQANLVELALS